MNSSEQKTNENKAKASDYITKTHAVKQLLELMQGVKHSDSSW